MKAAYKVVSIDPDTNCMNVEFSADGYETVMVGVRIPLEDEDVDQVIQSFAPMSVWFPRTTTPAFVPVGHTGDMNIIPPHKVNDMLKNAQMWEEVNFQKRLAKALVQLGVLHSDPTTLEVTQL